MRLQHIYIILVLLTLCSCDNNSVSINETTKSDSIVIDTIYHHNCLATNRPNHKEVEFLKDTLLNIKFEEITLNLSWTRELEGYYEVTDRIYGDTVIILADLGETIEDQKISILTDSILDLKIEQSYETSVTISDEGPHCDLVNWKHYNSEWKQLALSQDGYYVCLKYTEKESEKFPKIQIEDLKDQVKSQCGEHYYKLVSQIKSPTDDPSLVLISRHFIRISGQIKGHSQRFSKLIIVENPMGC